MYAARLLICLVIFQFKDDGVKSQDQVCKHEVCDEYCPYGNVSDAQGCNTCTCFDPCTNYTCPVDKECKRVAVVCKRPPCNPIAECGPPCPLIKCAKQCPNGYKLTKYGCPTCTCIEYGIKKCPLNLPCHSTANCPYGFELDGDGCQTCTCSGPCRDVTCPQNQYCNVRVLNCLVAPCPPPSPECDSIGLSYCPENSYLLTDFRNAPVGCSDNGETCPRGYVCHYVPSLNSSYCCTG